MDDAPRRRPAPAGPDRRRGLGCGRAARRRACRCATRSRSSSTAGATSARSRPTSRTAAAARARRSAPDELLRVPCDLDLAARRGPRRGRGALRRAGRARCATRSSAPTPCSTIWREPLEDLAGDARRRSTAAIALDVRLPAPPAAARRARRARAADRRHRRLRRAAARRGPAADGDRVRAAGRRARLPAARRPRALPRGLPRARRRARAPRWPSGSTARRPRSQRFLELSGDDFHESRLTPCTRLRGRAPRPRPDRRVAFGVFVFLGISFAARARR